MSYSYLKANRRYVSQEREFNVPVKLRAQECHNGMVGVGTCMVCIFSTCMVCILLHDISNRKEF